MNVGNGHKLYFELFGNPKGIPVLFFHGGPGAGFRDHHKKFFNPKVYNVIFFDQRGAGRSKPFASIKNNTTEDLIEDSKKLLDFLKVEKVLLFGGSWGSTLALLFAIKYPKHATGLILRGTFLAHRKDLEFYVSGGVRRNFPESWEHFMSLVPKNQRKNIAAYYLTKMQSKDKKEADRYALEWTYYESVLSKLKTTRKEILEDLKDGTYKALAPIEAYYIANNCFIPENYILKNAGKLSHLPVSIVHGRYDFVCPPENSYQLHTKIKGSKLYIVIAGHLGSEKEIEKKLISELNKFAKILS